jgi:plasmid stabilization system protein ParE
VTEVLQKSVRAIHDLERAIRLWELLRDNAQQVVNEPKAGSVRQEDSVATNPAVAKARAWIATCNTSILAARERIDELARGD